MKKLLVLLMLLGLVGATAYYRGWFIRGERETGLILSGNVEVTEANVGFRIAGRVVELAVDEGARVKRGDRLAALDAAEYQSLVDQNRAALLEAENKLEELRAGSRPQEIEEAAFNARSVEAELTRLKKDLQRAEFLHRNGAIATSQLDTARSAYMNTVSRHRGALERLSLVKEGPRREELRAAELRVEQARAALSIAEEKLRDTLLFAPFDGIILRKNAELGETCSQGFAVYTVGDLENPWIKVYVKEDRLGMVKLGQRAQISVDTYPGKSYEGTVTFISSEAEFTPKNVQTAEERVKLVFGVKVSARNENQELKPGMPADVRIFLNERDG
ncbi:MAG: HlyD family efflux transporter periplasmic adaptor subunit [Deltaproteobacteria bacterium]|nr:HlyD family efflux transporter periplasmic adaptor subunit [Deltaproteobacteria bacterium]